MARSARKWATVAFPNLKMTDSEPQTTAVYGALPSSQSQICINSIHSMGNKMHCWPGYYWSFQRWELPYKSRMGGRRETQSNTSGSSREPSKVQQLVKKPVGGTVCLLAVGVP